MEYSNNMAIIDETLKTIGILKDILANGKNNCGKDVEQYFFRDNEFLDKVTSSITLMDSDSLRNVLDEFRNLSQGFGSYCSDLKYVDFLIDTLYKQVKEQFLINR